MPMLDELADAGVVSGDVTAAAPTTLASHTSLMTDSAQMEEVRARLQLLGD
jgi:hypothetical protein